VGFTLQVVGQRDAPASHAALIMALEAVFAAIGGAIVLGERLDGRALVGAGLMLAAVIVAQLGAILSSRGQVVPLPHVPEP
jgi:drug/metabolite transporter (DMT)-like permease